MFISSVSGLHPDHFASQSDLIDAFERYWGAEHHNVARVRRFHEAVQVGGRHLALPVEDYMDLKTFGDANDAFISVGVDLGEKAIAEALASAGLGPKDVDAVFSASVTGIATPSLEARIAVSMGMRPDVKRIPLFGLGCVAGAAGIARVYDYLKAWPDHVAVLLSVELCSLTLQRKDLSVANLISSGLFGDGAAAVVCIGEERAKRMGLTKRPTVLATRSTLYPNTERVMGWDIGETGFKVVLDASVPKVIEGHLRADVEGFLTDHGLSLSDIQTWVCHPGGPKILQAFQKVLELPEDALSLTWESLRREGNMSSASVLFVLRDTLAQRTPPPGSYGLMIAMGPGFCSEIVLLQW